MIRILLLLITTISITYYNLDSEKPELKLRKKNDNMVSKVSNVKKIKIALSDKSDLFSYEVHMKSELSNNQYLLLSKKRKISKKYVEFPIEIPKKLKMFEKSKEITLRITAVDNSVLKNKIVKEIKIKNDVIPPKLSVISKTFNNNRKSIFNKIKIKVKDENEIKKLKVTTPKVSYITVAGKKKGEVTLLVFAKSEGINKLEIRAEDEAGNIKFHSTKLLLLKTKNHDDFETIYDYKESKKIKWEELKSSISLSKKELFEVSKAVSFNAEEDLVTLPKYSFKGKQYLKYTINKINGEQTSLNMPFVLGRASICKSEVSGKVVFVGENNFLKKYIVVKTDIPGLVFTYGFLKETNYKSGDQLKVGDRIGKVDNKNIIGKGAIKLALFDKHPVILESLENSLKDD